VTVTTFTFNNPAAVVTWTVPNHTGTLTIEARGGDGGRVPGARGGAWAGGGGNIRRSQRPRHCPRRGRGTPDIVAKYGLDGGGKG